MHDITTTDPSSLFRSQVLRYRSVAEASKTVLHQESFLGLQVFLSVSLMLIALAVLCLLQYKETEAVRGLLVTRGSSKKIVSPINAMLQQIKVSPGQHVVKGTVLATLSASSFDNAGRPRQQVEIEWRERRKNLLEQEHELLRNKFEDAREKNQLTVASYIQSLALLGKETELLKQQLDLSHSHLESLSALLANAAISQSLYDQYYAENLVLVREQNSFQQRQLQLQLQLERSAQGEEESILEFGLEKLQFEERSTQLEYEMAKLRSQSITTVIAEETGVVVAVVAEEGMPVNPGSPLIFLDFRDSNLQAELFVPSRVVGRLSRGQSVLLSYDAFNHRQFGRYPAIIDSIAEVSVDPREMLLPVPGIREPVFKVVVIPQQQLVEGPESYRLRRGLLLTADFVQEEMPLISYILQPLLDLRGKVM
jgi:membrane fusion protein